MGCTVPHDTYTLGGAFLVLKAVQGQQLTTDERASLPPPMLSLLATSGRTTLTRAERDRIPVDLLSQLAIAETVNLDADEFERSPPVVRTLVEQHQSRP